MKILKVVLVWAVVGLFLAAPALGDDLYPPPWRGEWSTTSQYWEFMTPNLGPLQPDGSPAGGQPWLPSTNVVVTPYGDWISYDPISGREGIWPLSGEIDVTVDNHNPPNLYKWVWVQLTWRPQQPNCEPSICEFNPLPVGCPEIKSEITLPGGWYHTTYFWEIRPNPPDEFFTIRGFIDVDELVVDTWCIPEPGTLGLLVLGSLALLRRRGT